MPICVSVCVVWRWRSEGQGAATGNGVPAAVKCADSTLVVYFGVVVPVDGDREVASALLKLSQLHEVSVH